MKKWLVIVGIIFLGFVGWVYFFVPSVITLKNSAIINATQTGLHRMLTDKKSVSKWWPGETTQGSFHLNNYNYEIYDNVTSVLSILIENKKASINTSLFLVPLQDDSVKVEWVAKTLPSYNPVKRITNYLNASQLDKDMVKLLAAMETYYSLPENIYGCEVSREQVVDANLISTTGKSTGYPTTEFIYNLINRLKDYAAEKHTQVTGYPMLNIEQADSTSYFVKVALPLENLIAGNGEILQKRMLKGGNILAVKTEGGYLKTNEIFNQVKNYAADYKMSSPAIPFYSLLTDRTKETDSSKWITKIYYPVR
jgi:hypothetical protein